MRKYLPEALLKLAETCRKPLYLVGGSVRDFLRGTLSENADWDLCSPMSEEELLSAAESCAFTVKSVFRNTGTVKLDDGNGALYEFTRFRSDKYVRGLHTPSEIFFTDDIVLDAKRRDFCANAVYYDVKRGELCDPLGGIGDISEKRLRTVAPASKVFGEDGLRLMRLCRIAAQTGFSPDEECLRGAKEHHALIRDIAPERVFSELMLLLSSDEKEGRSAPYRGLLLLKETGVLKEILPELALGEGLPQRKEFHDHDVLEHSLRCAMYAPREVRLAALLHDVGKPYCYLKNGTYYGHPEEGARIAEEILARFKAPKKLTEETVKLISLHMRDYNLEMRESKIRRELVECSPFLDKLFAVKQADYSACKDDLSPAPGVVKWQTVLQKMKQEGAPLTLSELNVGGDDLLALGVPPQEVGKTLQELLLSCAQDGRRNDREKLLDSLRKKFPRQAP